MVDGGKSTMREGMTRKVNVEALLTEVGACQVCAAHLPHGPRPIVQLGASARLVIIGQAPGSKVHASGVPWQDDSGNRLREWAGLELENLLRSSACRSPADRLLLSGRGRRGRSAAASRMCAALARAAARGPATVTTDVTRRHPCAGLLSQSLAQTHDDRGGPKLRGASTDIFSAAASELAFDRLDEEEPVVCGRCVVGAARRRS